MTEYQANSISEISKDDELEFQNHIYSSAVSDVVEITAFLDKNRVGYARLNKDKAGNVWTISEWFVSDCFQHKGYGRRILDAALTKMFEMFGEPFEIQYVWNGQNEYVFEWLKKNFTPISTCPIAIQKTQSDDDWSSHIYKLQKEKVLKYFELN